MVHAIQSQYFLIAPFRIIDWRGFESGLPSIWQPNHSYNSYSVKEHIASFLGYVEDSSDSILSSGLAYEGDLQQSEIKLLSSFKGSLLLCKSDGLSLVDYADPLTASNFVRLHLSPNRKCGLATISISCGTSTLGDVVDINYILHKSDLSQIPFFKKRSGFDKEKKEPVYSVKGTLMDVFNNLMPENGFIWENPARFVTACYVQVIYEQKDREEIDHALTLLGQAKDSSYELDDSAKSKILNLYENILTYSSPEGFACCVLNDCPGKEIPFIADSVNTFKNSYLPLYLTSVLSDLVLTSSLRNLNSIASDIKEQDRIREAGLAITLSPSHYYHLNRLLVSCLDGRNLHDKIVAIHDSIDARRGQLERERMEIEKQRQDLAVQKQQQIEKQDRSINYILGFIGIGQVVFAILEMTGVSRIFGDSFAEGSWGKGIVFFCSLLFIVAIFIYIKRLIKH